MKYVSVVIVDKAVESKGILSNAAFVLGLSAGRGMPETSFGDEVVDADGKVHARLTNIAHFVRKAGQSKLRRLREELSACQEVTITDYTEDAAPSDYETYAANLANRSADQIAYRAIHVYGPEEVVVPKTKNLSLLS